MFVFLWEILVGFEGLVSDYVDEINQKFVLVFQEKFVFIVWLMNDVVFMLDIFDEMWIFDFLYVEVYCFEKVGYYVQEDVYECVLLLLLKYLMQDFVGDKVVGSEVVMLELFLMVF